MEAFCYGLKIFVRVKLKLNVRNLICRRLNYSRLSSSTLHSYHYVMKDFHSLRTVNVSLVEDFRQRRFFSTNYPDHVIVKLPAMSPTMELGNISSWSVKEGDFVKEGDVLAETETDKATMVIEAPEDGYVAKILYPAGTKDLHIGEPILIMTANQDDITKFKDYKVPESERPTAASKLIVPLAKDPVGSASPQSTIKPQESARQRVSPLAKNLGKRSGDMFMPAKSKEISPSPKINIPPPPAPPPQRSTGSYTDVPLSNIRKVIATRLLQSKRDLPHYYTTMEVGVWELEKVRFILNSELKPIGIKLSMNDFVIKATALACKAVPQINAAWMETFIREYNNVDVSVAVSTPGGLYTPIIFNADEKPLRQISEDMKGLATKARQGQLKPNEYQGGTIAVSNLGMMGVHQFCAIINPPQCCILAVGTTEKRLYLRDPKKGVVGERSVITVTLSADHRIVDGALAASWLNAFKGFMESPKTMFS